MRPPEAPGRWHETRVRVRFHEVDTYRIAWHGHYVAWMEQARNELASRFGIDAVQIAAAGFQAPVVALEIRYLRPARYGDELLVRTTVSRQQTPSFQFLCRIEGPDGRLLATGRTLHALTDQDGVLQYSLPKDVAQRLEALYQFLGV